MSTSQKSVFIVGACRTPIGNINGSLSTLPAAKLGTVVIEGALNRAQVTPDKVSEVIMGQALTAAQGQNPARQASMGAGLPKEVPSTSVNMLCGSGKYCHMYIIWSCYCMYMYVVMYLHVSGHWYILLAFNYDLP